MKKLEIKDICSDIGNSIEEIKSFVPGNDGFMIVFELEIGKNNEQGAEIFQFTVCDEKGLINCILKYDDQYQKQGITSLKGNSLFVVKTFHIVTIFKYVVDILNNLEIEGKSWKRVAMELSGYFNWEYERETISQL